MKDLVEKPGLGKQRDEIRKGYRENPKKQIEVVRFLHERMDHQTHFE